MEGGELVWIPKNHGKSWQSARNPPQKSTAHCMTEFDKKQQCK